MRDETLTPPAKPFVTGRHADKEAQSWPTASEFGICLHLSRCFYLGGCDVAPEK